VYLRTETNTDHTRNIYWTIVVFRNIVWSITQYCFMINFLKNSLLNFTHRQKKWKRPSRLVRSLITNQLIRGIRPGGFLVTRTTFTLKFWFHLSRFLRSASIKHKVLKKEKETCDGINDQEMILFLRLGWSRELHWFWKTRRAWNVLVSQNLKK